MNKSTVYKLIESRRSELNTLVSIYGVSDHRVLVKSIELDLIINEYIQQKEMEEIQISHYSNDRVANTNRKRELIRS